MGELSLELKPAISSTHTPKSLSLFLGEVSRIGNVSEKLDKVDGYVRCLEEEMKKIDAFKRELPLCMLLLNDAIGVLKCELMHWKGSDARDSAVLEKFGNETNDLVDKKNWMSSAQLWTSNINNNNNNNAHSKTDPKHMEEMVKEDDRSEGIIAKNGGGAFVPFRGCSGFVRVTKENEKDNGIQVEPSLSLLTPGIKNAVVESNSYLLTPKSCDASRVIQSPETNHHSRVIHSPETNHHSSVHIPLQSQASRKQRRCWSPDLHRRFLNALQQLGGSQAATPKQIRELMKVEGLTNDEVKSHLQKYRLHTRRYPSGANANGNANVNAKTNANASTPDNQKLVLFGGLYVPQEMSGTSKSSTSQSESPQGPLQMVGTSGGTTSTTGGDSMDDEEDGKSESYNWKGHYA